MAKDGAKAEVTVDQLLDAKNVESIIEKLGFEQGLLLLEELVSRVESGSLPLERSISAYERGVGLVDRLKKHLSQAEEKLKILQRPK